MSIFCNKAWRDRATRGRAPGAVTVKAHLRPSGCTAPRDRDWFPLAPYSSCVCVAATRNNSPGAVRFKAHMPP